MSRPMEPVVHLSAAVALLGRFPVLAGVDLDVAHQEIVLLRGPNGAGKTSLLRACAGLIPVVRGEAVVLGHDLRVDPHAVRCRVGLLGHGLGLHDELTVGENVRFWGRATRASRADIEAALALTGLDGRLLDLAVGKLSAGQRRRTALACLLARRPQLWLLDEPHAGLDNDTRDQLDGIIRQAVSQGATVLLASHELERAEALADRVVELVGGMTTGTATPSSAPGPPADGPRPRRDEGGLAGDRGVQSAEGEGDAGRDAVAGVAGGDASTAGSADGAADAAPATGGTDGQGAAAADGDREGRQGKAPPRVPEGSHVA